MLDHTPLKLKAYILLGTAGVLMIIVAYQVSNMFGRGLFGKKRTDFNKIQQFTEESTCGQLPT